MKAAGSHRGFLTRLLCVGTALLVLLLPGPASSADYGAEISLGSIYTSNLTLTRDDLAEPQWVNAVVPSVFIEHKAARWSADFNYELQTLFYAGESELNEAFSQLWTTGLLNLIGDELLLFGFARATQVNLDPEGRLPGNNINVTNNRSDALVWEVGPQWRQTLFGASSVVDAYYYVGRIKFADADTQGADTQVGEFSLRSDPASTRRLEIG